MYAIDHQFDQQTLGTIRPEQLVRYFRLISYGNETPGPTDQPTLRRSSGISFCKKAISYFMADGSAQWNSQGNTGNPTMSKAVNKCIQEIKKHEVRKQGKKSNAKRDLKWPEFKKTLELLNSSSSLAHRYKIPAMFKLQFHLIGRSDDICNLETKDLRENEEFPGFALQTKVAWSKNVNEERDCPDQIILGVNDPDFCPLLALAGYLESRFTDHWGTPRFLFGERDNDDEPLRMNDNYLKTLKTIWKRRAFQELAREVRGDIGTHSIRKFATTWCAEHGITPPEIEIRGRWKGARNGRVVNLYINVKQLPTDGKVAGVLCVGQPVKYKLMAGTEVTRAWLLANVVPGIHEHFSDDNANKIADVLALPLLWACHDPVASCTLSPAVAGRVTARWTIHCVEKGLPRHELGNPVETVVLQVHRYENQLVINELVAVPEGPGDGNGVNPLVVANRVAGNQQQLSILTNQVHQLKLDLAQVKMELSTAIAELRNYDERQLTLLHKTLGKLLHQAPTRRVANRPANAATAAGLAAATGKEFAPLRAALSKCPRNLHEQWREWTDGLEGFVVPSYSFNCLLTLSLRYMTSTRVLNSTTSVLYYSTSCTS